MKTTSLFITVILTAVAAGYSQPQPIWWRLYDQDQQSEALQDIYHLAGGGFITKGVCGEPVWGFGDLLLMKLDEQGDMVWRESYETNSNPNWGAVANVIEADNGDIVTTALHNNKFAVLRVTSEGEEVWWNEYGDGDGKSKSVIELKSGDFIAAGFHNNTRLKVTGDPYIIKINGIGELLWDYSIPTDDGMEGVFTSLRETDGGTVAAGFIHIEPDTLGGPPVRYGMAIKLDVNGELVWSRKYDTVRRHYLLDIYSMVALPDGGFAMTGDDNEYPFLLLVDDEGLEESRYYYEIPEMTYPRTIALDGDNFTLVGSNDYLTENHSWFYRPFALSVNAQGEERWRSTYILDENHQSGYDGAFCSVVYDQDDCGWAVGYWYNNDDYHHIHIDALVVKLEPDQGNPVIFSWMPRDTVLYRLPGDTTTFLVRAHDQQGDQMSFLWTFDGDTVGTDTMYFATSPDECREVPVSCTVSDADGNATAITWHVNVVDFYITGYQPDSTAFTIRRGTTIDFGLSIRAAPGDPFDYLWEVNHRDVGTDSALSYLFDFAGLFDVTCEFGRGGGFTDVSWTLDVRSLIADYYPIPTDMQLPQDTTCQFLLVPFEVDSLSYLWLFNGESIGMDSSIVLDFPDLGLQRLVGWVRSPADSDSVVWTINVQERNSASDLRLSTWNFGLSEPCPNPFNSQAVTSYKLQVSSWVKLGMYDLSGRLVQTLVEGWQEAGAHRVTIDGSLLASGLYIARLEAGGKTSAVKMVCVE